MGGKKEFCLPRQTKCMKAIIQATPMQAMLLAKYKYVVRIDRRLATFGRTKGLADWEQSAWAQGNFRKRILPRPFLVHGILLERKRL